MIFLLTALTFLLGFVAGKWHLKKQFFYVKRAPKKRRFKKRKRSTQDIINGWK